MIRNATKLIFTLLVSVLLVPSLWAQTTEFELTLPTSDDIMSGYAVGLQSGARDIAGPFDLDGDSQYEILVSDYTGGGRVHVIENRGVDTWELVYSTPWLDSTGTTNNIRAIAGGDLDGDGMGEIVFLAGRDYSDASSFPVGLYVFENDGDDSYGDAPASIYEFNPDDAPDRWRTEQIDIFDVDGDGAEELFFGNNGADNRHDNWFVLSVNGDIGGGFEVWVEELRLSSRSDDFDLTSRGGGSPYAIHPADLDGDGLMELSMHSWNNFNLTVVGANGDGSYTVPDDGFTNYFLQASTEDQVSFFGGTVIDIDGNGDHEIFYPNLQTGNVAILNYETGEDVLQVTMSNIVLDLLPGLSSLGIASGDLDGDGSMELIGTGPGYTDANITDGTPAAWFNIAEYNGGDPEDPASYSPVTAIVSTSDTYDGFHTLNRLDGTTERSDNALDLSVRDSVVVTGSGNPEFASKFAYLGDADMDGVNELAFGIQGVRDSLYTLTEFVAATDSTDALYSIDAVVANENRTFMRVLTMAGTTVSIDDERLVLPDDYKLHANYPNPFNPTTTIGFTLPLEKAVSIKVYDVSGRLVKTLVDNQIYNAGTYEVTWDGTSNAGGSVSSGTYLYSLEYGNFRQSRTMTLIK